jgi:hypothetical protein
VADKRIILVGQSLGARSLNHWRAEKPPHHIFLLSPANVLGARARMLFSPRSQFNLALRLRQSGAPLGEVYSFISGLYFRGKLTYAENFGNPPPGLPGVHIITAAAGLSHPATLVTLSDIRKISATAIDADNQHYRKPLIRDLRALRNRLDAETRVVLLGSIATSKYVEPLLEVFGAQLFFPEEFVGRGDMSRGGLLLRRCALGQPLKYVAVAHAVRHGKRPAKLARI